MKQLSFIALIALAMSAFASDGESLNLKESFESYDPAVKVFALSEANSAAYQLRLLQTGNIGSPFRPNLDIFERYFPALHEQEQLKLALLILIKYDLDGEYGEQFDLMTNGIRPSFSMWIQKLDRKRLREFVTRYHGDWKSFVNRCFAHFRVRL
jgi:hypothetical protein